ncbi:TPA: hypothetical protein QEM49_003966 [Pseudomonas putida]|uniref:hypothetical protein n=1 Tax=Pseudomonas putida TaxID=303 RepID=UPI0023646162|nr:hypothetical protein [Pseudomonas putida]MDD2009612.1 hypothetical protein [Pseudomonas putida]HDS1779418.1 hypothetical protein [Pseudomonas putida]
MSHGFEGEIGSAKIAKLLGISVDDADAYVTIDTNESDDGLVYSYIANFDRSTPKSVLEVAGAEGTYFVELSANAFDEEE